MLRIKELRKERNMTMKQLGEEIGVAESTISLYENAKRQPDNTTLQRLADYFDVSVDYLLGRTEERQVQNNDTELNEYLEELRTRPELKMMFNLAKGATKEDVEKAVKIIETLLDKN